MEKRIVVCLNKEDWYRPADRDLLLGQLAEQVGRWVPRENVVALRAVVTSDFMTAHWAELPYTLLGKVSNRIINEVRGINRVVYDISGKPPATIEWE